MQEIFTAENSVAISDRNNQKIPLITSVTQQLLQTLQMEMESHSLEDVVLLSRVSISVAYSSSFLPSRFRTPSPTLPGGMFKPVEFKYLSRCPGIDGMGEISS